MRNIFLLLTLTGLFSCKETPWEDTEHRNTIILSAQIESSKYPEALERLKESITKKEDKD